MSDHFCAPPDSTATNGPLPTRTRSLNNERTIGRQGASPDLKDSLVKPIQDNHITSEQADAIVQEAIKRNFEEAATSTDDRISYTGWLTLSSVGGGAWYFSSWSGNFKMGGWLAPAVGAAMFFYAYILIEPKYNYDGCEGDMTFQLTPLAMTLNLAMDDKGNIPVGEGVASAGPSFSGGAGAGSFKLRRY
ncbi:MAG: hypothetical protein ACRDV9_01940 [Acidimicrobiia bacterium]